MRLFDDVVKIFTLTFSQELRGSLEQMDAMERMASMVRLVLFCGAMLLLAPHAFHFSIMLTRHYRHRGRSWCSRTSGEAWFVACLTSGIELT